jgi:NTP pyrophosphatase (non-canonical NTP hydrolase)
MNRLEELNNRVIAWADDKGILAKATPLTQIAKTQEELDETREALHYQSKNEEIYINAKGVMCETDHEIKDGIGDVLVTLLIQCKMQGLDPLDCLEMAVKVIENRKGKMINGTFVKN